MSQAERSAELRDELERFSRFGVRHPPQLDSDGNLVSPKKCEMVTCRYLVMRTGGRVDGWLTMERDLPQYDAL